MVGRGSATAWRGRDHTRCPHRLASVPGIGPVLAHRVHELLDVHTVEELEAAARDGRLARVPGFGARRLRGVVETLAGRLGPRPRPAAPLRPLLPIAELLDVDREYRDKAAHGALIRIAPHRFNPEHRPWLPVLRTRRDGRQYTALFSNTARAHALGKTEDWVVLYGDDGLAEREATVVTETMGPLVGLRVVRGREAECAELYGRHEAAADLGGSQRGSHVHENVRPSRAAAGVVAGARGARFEQPGRDRCRTTS